MTVSTTILTTLKNWTEVGTPARWGRASSNAARVEGLAPLGVRRLQAAPVVQGDGDDDRRLPSPRVAAPHLRPEHVEPGAIVFCRAPLALPSAASATTSSTGVTGAAPSSTRTGDLRRLRHLPSKEAATQIPYLALARLLPHAQPLPPDPLAAPRRRPQPPDTLAGRRPPTSAATTSTTTPAATSGRAASCAFPIQEDDHLLRVAGTSSATRWRAGLVERAESWPWSSCVCAEQDAGVGPGPGAPRRGMGRGGRRADDRGRVPGDRRVDPPRPSVRHGELGPADRRCPGVR